MGGERLGGRLTRGAMCQHHLREVEEFVCGSSPWQFPVWYGPDASFTSADEGGGGDDARRQKQGIGALFCFKRLGMAVGKEHHNRKDTMARKADKTTQCSEAKK